MYLSPGNICFWGARSRNISTYIIFVGTFGGLAPPPPPPNTKKLATLLLPGPLSGSRTPALRDFGLGMCAACTGGLYLKILDPPLFLAIILFIRCKYNILVDRNGSKPAYFLNLFWLFCCIIRYKKGSNLFQTPVTEENVVEVSEELANLTQPAEELSSNGVASTADILQDITALNSTEPAVNCREGGREREWNIKYFVYC